MVCGYADPHETASKKETLGVVLGLGVSSRYKVHHRTVKAMLEYLTMLCITCRMTPA